MTSFFLQGLELLEVRALHHDSIIGGIFTSVYRRFYRRKYNAEQALADFAATARNETDLEALTAKLVEVVSQTVQPVQVRLWLRRAATPSQPRLERSEK